MSNRDLLIEIGTEELPPKALLFLSGAFQKEIEKNLNDCNLKFSGSKSFATPRRLTVKIDGLKEMQDAISIEKFGPTIKAAFDEDGKATKAAEGFARSCGVAVEELDQKDDDKVVKLYFTKQEEGKPAVDLLPDVVNGALDALPIPKRMRWGSLRDEFVRPVHWAMILFGSEVVPTSILGVEAGSTTRGHRFHSPEEITVPSPADYEKLLSEKGYVIPCFEKRMALVRAQVESEAEKLGAIVTIENDLLEEVTALVEWPVALTGSFDEAFLAVPKEALVSSMKKHQKCFTLEDSNGNILPHFITVSNLESQDPQKVVAGNERVIRPRLADAAFFFEQDKNTRLESRQEKLKTVIFENTLGTVHDKSMRVERLAAFIADAIGADSKLAIRAAKLGKCDLLTGMVGEFADLQGIMGYYYALHDGENEEVARALNEQYMPRFAGDELPSTKSGIVLALAERIDTIVGLFGIGQPPTGSKDPYALRRAALGILRIIVEKELPLDLADCVANAIFHYPSLPEKEGLKKAVLDFIFERFRAWYIDEGVSANIFLAVDAVRPSSPLDFSMRINAVQEFASLKEAEALSKANKRVSNILAKSDSVLACSVDSSLLSEEAEKELARQIQSLLDEVGPLLLEQNYTAALSSMASLQAGVDRFFDEVMVNTEDEKVRNNRQSLLNQLRKLFLQIADISLLQAG